VSAPPVYDLIGANYAAYRRSDPRWATRIHAALGAARSIINVGAGTGSYEPDDRLVVAIEPSQLMIDQRPPGAPPAFRGTADALPYPDQSFDAALAVLTVHHWPDATAGLAELRRVARRQVVVTWDPAVFAERMWLVRDYLPEVAVRESRLATLDVVIGHLAPTRIHPLPVPADFTDAVLGAHWSRPHAYLDPALRSANSGLALLDPDVVAAAINRLSDDLGSGRWHQKYGALLALDELDLGYRLVVAEQPDD
jgi:SAM-dependent methyltransferase